MSGRFFQSVLHLLTPCELAGEHIVADRPLGCVIGMGLCIWQNFAAGVAHLSHSCAQSGILPAGDSSQNCCPEKDGIRLLG